jgi:hypothetical protein
MLSHYGQVVERKPTQIEFCEAPDTGRGFLGIPERAVFDEIPLQSLDRSMGKEDVFTPRVGRKVNVPSQLVGCFMERIKRGLVSEGKTGKKQE